jgi:hypothetical protein
VRDFYARNTLFYWRKGLLCEGLKGYVHA